MTRADVQTWLDRYVAAWASYDPALIGDLFSVDAEYRYHPSDRPVVGRQAIVRSWLEPSGPAGGRDEPGTFEARYEPWALDGRRAVAVGSTRYFTDATGAALDRAYDNAFLIEFDADGRCRSFTEFFRKRP